VFENMVFIGGSPCAGKSTLALQLANAYGLQYYNCDDRWDDHVNAANSSDQLTLTRMRSTTWVEPMTRDVKTMLRDEMAAFHEQFQFIQSELEAVSIPTIVEGAALMPELIANLGVDARAAYLIPTQSFQREHYAKRDWARVLVSTTSDAERTFDYWMARDVLFADYVEASAQSNAFPILRVDGSLTLSETKNWLEEALRVQEH
jgi:adenylate kinase family enzyme